MIPAIMTLYYYCTGEHSLPPVSHTEPAEACHVNNSLRLIIASCPYPGFQVVVFNREHKIYVNETRHHQTTTVLVQDNGAFGVAIFPILEETGIVYSDVIYRELIVDDIPGKL